MKTVCGKVKRNLQVTGYLYYSVKGHLKINQNSISRAVVSHTGQDIAVFRQTRFLMKKSPMNKSFITGYIIEGSCVE